MVGSFYKGLSNPLPLQHKHTTSKSATSFDTSPAFKISGSAMQGCFPVQTCRLAQERYGASLSRIWLKFMCI